MNKNKFSKFKKSILIVLTVGFIIPILNASFVNAGEVNIYSYRQPFLIQPLLDAYTKKTGNKVNINYAGKGLVEKIKSEGKNTPADVLLTVGVKSIKAIEGLGLTEKIVSKSVLKSTPKSMIGKDKDWVALTQRARILYVSKDRMKKGEITTYEELADPRFKGKVCMRTGSHEYNVALVSYMISVHGIDYAKKWVKGLKANLARKPKGNDRAQVKAVYEGICDIAIANDYYYGKMLKNKDQVKWAESVNLVWPNQNDRGVHVNVSSISVLKHAKNKKEAVELVEFLASIEGQKLYDEKNTEMVVSNKVDTSKTRKHWYKNLKNNTLKKDENTAIYKVIDNIDEAIKIIIEAGLNK